MIEILLGALAQAIIDHIIEDLAQRPGLVPWRDRLRGDSLEKVALQRALAAAYVTFTQRYSDLANSLFDEYFLLKPEIAAELAKLLTPDQKPDTFILQKVWLAQFPHKPNIDLSRPLSDFLDTLTQEIKAQSALKPFVDSRAFDQLYTIAQRGELQLETQNQMRELLAEIRNLLKHIVEPTDKPILESVMSSATTAINPIEPSSANKPEPEVVMPPLSLPQPSWKFDYPKPQPILAVSQISQTLKGYDPFPHPWAEHELAFLFGEMSGFWSRYPVYATISANFLPEVILAEPGGGKTALAYALSQLGDVGGKPLTNTLPLYLIGEHVAPRNIPKEVALALFNFGRVNSSLLLSLTQSKQKKLAHFWLNSLDADMAKPRLTTLFEANQSLVKAIRVMKAAPWKNPQEWLLFVQESLGLLGFDRLILAIDFNEPKIEDVTIYLQNMREWAMHGLILKVFLPTNLTKEVERLSDNVKTLLTWTDDLLAEMTRWRYDSIARLTNIHGGPELLFDEGVYPQFIQRARGNPGRLAQLWRYLFNDHLQYSPDQLTFSAENLARAVEQLK